MVVESRFGEASLNELFVKYGEYVFLVHDQNGVAARLVLELVAGPGGEQHPVALLDLERTPRAVLHELAGTDRQDGAALGLLFGAVRDDDAAGRLVSRL